MRALASMLVAMADDVLLSEGLLRDGRGNPLRADAIPELANLQKPTAADVFATDRTVAQLAAATDPSGRFSYASQGVNPFNVASGYLRQAGATGAGYLGARLAATPKIAGMVYDIDPTGDDQNQEGGLVALIIGDFDPAHDFAVYPYWRAIHISINSTAWYVQFIDNPASGALNLTTRYGALYTGTLAAGEHKLAARLEGRQLILHLPDGTTQTMEDDRFLTFAGPTVVWEAIIKPGRRQPRIKRIGVDDFTLLNPVPSGEQLIAETFLLADTATMGFANIPKGFTDLRVVGGVRSTAAATSDRLLVSINGDTANANYDHTKTAFLGSTSTTSSILATTNVRAVPYINGNTAVAASFSQVDLTFPEYATAVSKMMCGRSWSLTNRSANGQVREEVLLAWASILPITDLTFGALTGPNLLAGSWLRLYGTRSFIGTPRTPDA